MTTRLTIKDLEKLQKEGKIRGFYVVNTVKKVAGIKVDKGSKNKKWLQMNLEAYAEANGLILITEFTFHPSRKFRADWALTNEARTVKILCEYEGIFSEKSRHTTFDGYNRDSEKYNLAASAGWTVLRYTAKSYKRIFDDLNSIVNERS